MEEQEEEELTGVRATAAEQWRACREDGDLLEQCIVEEEERRWR
jgi:hypothetical protein